MTKQVKKQHRKDVIVIGGGHAGCEAAFASARMGVETLLLTHKIASIGEMSCNPAIGGVGKGHLVREIDALGGLMGRVADQAGIQFRLLNLKKGPAVRGPRAQCDRKIYKHIMQKAILNTDFLEVREMSVERFIIDKNGCLEGVLGDKGQAIYAKAVILTTGTFLNGLIHMGQKTQKAGRLGAKPSTGLAQALCELELPMGRLKTGTPARLDRKTIDFSVLNEQKGDKNPCFFSFSTKETKTPQTSCYITYTNQKTHKIIADNIHLSPIYSGQITSQGPRYCPSIEDKIKRFPHHLSHQIFLEPEGIDVDNDIIYPNGISTALPETIQKSFIRSIKGLEKVEITQFGYAIEYDYIDPRALFPSLALKPSNSLKSGLFLAGQINGTTGYEEAGAQGLVAGVNAALFARGQEPDFILSRSDAYIGVLVDDLTTKGVSEPYRMFTSRAEYRLTLRADNADERLTPLGIERGLIDKVTQKRFLAKQKELKKARQFVQSATLTPTKAEKYGLLVKKDGIKRSIDDLLAHKHISWARLADIFPVLRDFSQDIKNQIMIDAQYKSYLLRQSADIEAFNKDESLVLPLDIDYLSLEGLSLELRQKLHNTRPHNLGQASRLDFMTPGGLTCLLYYVKKTQSSSKSPKIRDSH